MAYFLLVSALVGRVLLNCSGDVVQIDRDEAIEVARQHPRVQEFLERHADAELHASYSREFQVWIVELRDGQRRLGMVSVRDEKVVEIDLKEGKRDRPRSAVELVENTPRLRELRERFSEAQLQLGPTDDPETQWFELVVDGREVAGGTVNAEAGWVRFRDQPERAERDRTEAERGFLPALFRAVQFPLEGNGLFWFSAAVTVLVIFPFRSPLRLQSLDVLAILVLFPLAGIVWGHRFATYQALFLVTGYLCVRCLWKAFERSAKKGSGVFVAEHPLGGCGQRLPTPFSLQSGAEPPNVPLPVLIGTFVLVLAAHVQVVVTRGPDDSGIWSVFGGQYLREHGRLPYGQIGEGATYGPLLYAIHAPVAYLLPPTAPGDGGRRVIVDRHNIERVGYSNCNFLPAKVVVLAFDVALLAGLVVLGRQVHSLALGVAFALIYAVNGLTIERDLLFVSHVAPAACVVLAIACQRYPVASGLLLGCGASILFWPAFLIPLWLGFFASRGWKDLVKGGSAIGAVGLTMLVALWLYTEPIDGRGPLRVFLDSTWGHQEGGGPYSHSKFGLWGQWIERHPDRAEAITQLKTVVRWSYLALCLVPIALSWRGALAHPAALTALSAFFALGLQFWKTHGGGLYIGWYLPLVIATLFATRHAGLSPGRPVS